METEFLEIPLNGYQLVKVDIVTSEDGHTTYLIHLPDGRKPAFSMHYDEEANPVWLEDGRRTEFADLVGRIIEDHFE